jgi:hypothetical protein
MIVIGLLASNAVFLIGLVVALDANRRLRLQLDDMRHARQR